MVKNILLGVVCFFLMASVCQAEVDWNELMSNVEWKQGIGFSVEESAFNVMSTFKVAKWKDLTLSAGYMGDAEQTNHKAVANLSYSLLKLKKYIDIPILDLIEIEPGLWAGWGNVNMKEAKEWEFDYGFSVSLISLKF